MIRSISNTLLVTLVAGGALLSSGTALASSHREAPLIIEDSTVDATDLYAFLSPDGPAPGAGATVTIVANYGPFEEPAGPPNYYRFSDTALYEIKIDNTGDAVEDIVYQFQFSTSVQNPLSFLYNFGPIAAPDSMMLNVRQLYNVTRLKLTNGKVVSSEVLGANLPTAPARIGPQSTPNYDTLASLSVAPLTHNHKVFCGPRDDPFYVDINAIFDLLSINRVASLGGTGPAKDGTAGFNVHSLALQIPVTELSSDGMEPTDKNAANAVIGVWTTASRKKIRVLRSYSNARHAGPWIQVSRLGLPLVNEVLVPILFKDQFNRSAPRNDVKTIAGFVVDPELSRLLHLVHNVVVPTPPRTELLGVITFLPGLLTSRMDLAPADLLRLNLGIPQTAAAMRNRLGAIAGDLGGFPNGRRPGDDAVDVLERVIGGGILSMQAPPTGGTFGALSPNNVLGDGVDANDVALLDTFPYLGLPHEGYVHSHGP